MLGYVIPLTVITLIVSVLRHNGRASGN